MVSKFYGIDYKPVPDPDVFLEENDVLELDGETWECILAPGHSPASICFFSKAHGVLIAGDVLFEGSIGRTDLPGGDYNTLINSIRKKLFPLGNNVVVYPGHGGITTIGQEILTNPFLS